ncbi:MAG TPA: MazG family protein [Trueperaceae bacterium]
MQKLLEIMRRLRAPDGCPWDRKQTHESLRSYLLEEAAEAVDAISSGDTRAIADELGDVLLQVAFHSVIGEEEGSFDYDDVESAIVAKLVRRHPHIFADTTVSGADEVVTNWQAIKAAEREERGEAPRSALDSVPRSLPALLRAAEVAKAARWEPPAEPPRLAGDDAGEIGEHLLAVASYARSKGVDPEIALREAIDSAVVAEGEGG